MDQNHRKYKTPLPSIPKYLPITQIPEKPKFTGTFTGNEVIVTSQDEIQELYNCGCFGNSGQFQKEFVNERYYELVEGIDRDEVNDKNKRGIGINAVNENLSLFLEEAFFLNFSLKILKILDEVGNEIGSDDFLLKCINVKPDFVSCFVSYHYFRAKNWVVKSGINFGSDFLLYKLGPQFYHSQYMVKVKKSKGHSEKFPSKELLGWYRISETSKKECLLIDVIFPQNITNPIELIRNLSNFKVDVVTFKRYNPWKSKLK
uniref:tRNA-intron lyase n=1 Tax=Culicoides sonorensis TaxID=179676 RepID=A0A336L6J9_CULSO